MSGLLIPFFCEHKEHSNCKKIQKSNKSLSSPLFLHILFPYKKVL